MITMAAVWLVSVTVLGGGYILFYLPQKVELAQITNQCTKAQTELEEAQLAAQDQVKAKQNQRQEQIHQLISSFSTEQDAVTELVFEIGRIAHELGLSDFSSKNNGKQNYSTVGESKVVSEAWLDVDFVANFEQFAKFINRLESNNPVVFIEEIAFQRGSADSNGHKVSLKLSFLTETCEKNKKVAAVAH